MKNQSIALLCAPLFLLLAITSCGNGGETSTESEYAELSSLPVITPKTVLTISDSDALLFNFVSHVEPTSEGQILALDARTSRAFLFSGDGTLLETGIGEGRGPGESRFTSSRFSLNDNDEFMIFSQALRRASIYRIEDGSIHHLADLAMERFPNGFELLSDGNILIYERKETTPDGRDYERFSIISPEGEVVRDEFLTFPGAERLKIRNEAGALMVSISTPHHPANMFAADDDIMLVASHKTLGFDMYSISSGELLREVRLPVREQPISRDEKRVYVEAYLEAFGMSSSLASGLLSEMPDTRGVISDIRYDRSGFVWLQLTYGPDEPENTYRWIVLSEKGELLGRWDNEAGARLLYVQDGRMYTASEDENELQQIQILDSGLETLTP